MEDLDKAQDGELQGGVFTSRHVIQDYVNNTHISKAVSRCSACYVWTLLSTYELTKRSIVSGLLLKSWEEGRVA
eukprot:6629253-Pyramimonas_sp.AAC.2